MKNTFSKQEIIDWIDFLYNDLLTHRILIGGFYFTFNQLPKFKLKKQEMDQKFEGENNKGNIYTQKSKKDSNMDLTLTSNLIKNVLSKPTEIITTNIFAINKYNETINLPVTYEEFMYVYDKMVRLKGDIEHFKSFLLEELEGVKKGDESAFFTFINDLATDIKTQLKNDVSYAKEISLYISKVK